MFRNTSLVFLGRRLVLLTVVALGQIVMAQEPAAPQQNSESAPVYNDDPMSLPPRTAPPPSSAEEPARPDSITPLPKDGAADDQGRFVFKKQVQEVVLHATVVDESGQPVTSLDRSAFTVYQNGQQQTITSFRREDVPVAIGIVVDNSGSMRDKRAKVSQAVANLLQASNPQDEIFVVNFSQTPYLDQDFTSNASLLQAALHQTSTRGSTALYDAVVASEVHLRNNPRLNKKVLLVITDGQDNMSRETLDQALRKLESNKGPTVYAIGLTDSGLTRTGRDALQRLASETGGVAYFPNTLEDVDSITKAVARDVRSQYTLTYSPGNATGQGYQRIKVEAKTGSRKRLDVRTRDGYYPGETLR